MKQVNSWRPYEAPYVKAMAMSGVTPSECERRLMLVNNKLGAPYRGADTITRMCSGSFKKYIDIQRENRNKQIIEFATKTGDVLTTARKFGCTPWTVRNVLSSNGLGRVHTIFWTDWECVYVLGLNAKGLSSKEIAERLKLISLKLGRAVRTKDAIVDKIIRLKRGATYVHKTF